MNPDDLPQNPTPGAAPAAPPQGTPAASPAAPVYPLDQIWQHIVAQNTALTKAGQPPLQPNEIDQFIQANSGGKYSIHDITDVSARNVGRSFAQGVTMGHVPALFDDVDPTKDPVLSALAKQVPGYAMPPVNHASAEDSALRDRLFKQLHPNVAGPAMVSGGIGAMAFAPEAAAGTVPVEEAEHNLRSLFNDFPGTPPTAAPGVLRVVRGAVTGAGVGSFAADGSDSDAASRTTQTGLAAILGAAVPAAAELSDYLSPVTAAQNYIRGAVARAGGAEAAANKTRALQTMGKGDISVLADYNPRLRALADMAATRSPDAAATIEPVAVARQAGMSGRLNADVTALTPELGMPPRDATTAAAALHKANMDWAAGPDGYGGLRTENPEVANTVLPGAIPPEARAIQAQIDQLRALPGDAPAAAPGNSVFGSGLSGKEAQIAQLQAKFDALVPPMNPQESAFAQLLKQPYASRALNDANILGKIGDELQPDEQPSFEKMWHIKGRIDAATQAAWAAKDGDLGTRLGQLGQNIDNHLVENVPGYSAVTQEYAQRMGLERGLEKGVDAWNSTDNAPFATLVAKLSPQELFNFRYGMASELASKITNAAKNVDVAHQLVDASIAKDAKLMTMFGSQSRFDMFMKMADQEAEFAKLRGTYTGSATQRRAIASTASATDQALSSTAHGAGAASFQSLKGAALRAVSASARNTMRASTAEALAPMLMTKGTPAIDAFLRALTVPTSPGGPLAAPGALMGLLPSALNQPPQ